MIRHNSEWVSALADNQLTGIRRWLVQRHVKSCASCAAELQQQQRVSEMLAANPPQFAMSDSEDFFWSKVKHDIETRFNEPVTVPIPAVGVLEWFAQRRFAFASVSAGLIAALGLMYTLNRPRPAQVATVVNASTDLPDTDATALKGKDPGVSVIWVSGLPWTSDMSEMKSLYDHQDT